VAYRHAIIIALSVLTKANMNLNHHTSMRRSRSQNRSVVSPIVLFDSPRYPRKGSQSIRIDRRRPTTPQALSKSGARNDEFRYFVDRQGRQHFNFRQRVWLDATVQMAYTRVYSIALITLAVNLLTLVTRKRDFQAAVGCTSRRVVLLAPSFSRECLLGAPDEAWAVPRTTIKAWLESRVRTAPRPR
jgi:hypothetical protein